MLKRVVRWLRVPPQDRAKTSTKALGFQPEFSTIDTNETTFAIKSPAGRIVDNRSKTYSWPVHPSNIYVRYQNLTRLELDLLYKKLQSGTFAPAAHFQSKS